MLFEPHRVPAGTIVYRGIDRNGWLYRQRDPWGVRYGAFIRKQKDDDGLTVTPEASQCCEIELIQIAKIDVAEIEKMVNPITGEKLYVWQDAIDHACIPNLPFHHEHAQAAQDLATDLAEVADILTTEEFNATKRERGSITDVTERIR